MPRKKKEIESVSRDPIMADTQITTVAAPSEGDQLAHDTQKQVVPPANKKRRGHDQLDTQTRYVSSLSGEGDHAQFDTQEKHVPLPQLVQTVTELCHRRQAWHKAEKSLSLQIFAFCRRLCDGGKEEAKALYKAVEQKKPHPLAEVAFLSTFPLFAGREPIERERMGVEKQLRKLGAQLPGAHYCTETHGLTTFTLAMLIGACPGLNSLGFLDFDTPSKVWKRLGLAVMPDGQRQRKVSGAEAIAHGYNPERRSMVWTLGNPLIYSKGPYKLLYDRYKEQERAKAEAKGLTILPSAQITEERKASGQYISDGQIHNRAKRRMEKAMLCDVWAAFRSEAGMKTTSTFAYQEAA